ncbi:hypothetical protein DESC_890006 [Desulfosarcina cetonica]|nr:hypothetical protein DESC_890006 [Desulfosarcina cetonica]
MPSRLVCMFRAMIAWQKYRIIEKQALLLEISIQLVPYFSLELNAAVHRAGGAQRKPPESEKG